MTTEPTNKDLLREAARRPVTPETVAAVCLRMPSERDAILRLLHRTRGNAYVQQVLAAVRVLEAQQGKPPIGNGGESP